VVISKIQSPDRDNAFLFPDQKSVMELAALAMLPDDAFMYLKEWGNNFCVPIWFFDL